ncbi:MAG: hypothetical protein Hals2KO_00940 [Halioglobus sp.]
MRRFLGARRIRRLVISCWLFSLPAAAAPITDTLIINGLEWAQPDLFVGLSWNEINAVCPAGTCQQHGVLLGHDVSGWTWANSAQMHGLFNAYIGSAELGPGVGSYSTFVTDNSLPDPFSFGFFADGWRPTLEEKRPAFFADATVLRGFMADSSEQLARINAGFIPANLRTGGASTDDYLWQLPGDTKIGAWFFQQPATSVDAPGTMVLLGGVLLLLTSQRRARLES